MDLFSHIGIPIWLRKWQVFVISICSSILNLYQSRTKWYNCMIITLCNNNVVNGIIHYLCLIIKQLQFTVTEKSSQHLIQIKNWKITLWQIIKCLIEIIETVQNNWSGACLSQYFEKLLNSTLLIAIPNFRVHVYLKHCHWSCLLLFRYFSENTERVIILFLWNLAFDSLVGW